MRSLKKFLLVLFISVLIICSCLNGFVVHGYDYQIDSFNYSPYTNLCKLDDIITSGGQVLSLDFTYYATCSGNTLTFYNTPYQDRVDYDESDYLATYNELIDSTTFVVGEYYFINDNSENYLFNACLYNVYYNYQIYSYYDSAYATGITETQVGDAFNKGYSRGMADSQKLVDNAILQTNQSAQNIINYQNSEIDRLNAIIDSGDNGNWANFKNLLSVIFMFPIKFFKEGFGVEVWGVNIGYFIIGVFMIAITLTIIALVGRGKRE